VTRRDLLAAFGGVAAPLFLRQAKPPQRAADGPASRVQTLRPSAALPAEIVGTFREPLAFQQSDTGQFYVFDRRGHTVYGIDAAMTSSWVVVRIGQEAGHILEPMAFALAPDGTFVVADRPTALERVQRFSSGGRLMSGFTIPGRPATRLIFEGTVLSGIASLQYHGRTLFVSQPETGALITEYALTGEPVRTLGVLRKTGFEDTDRDLHLALNSGIPLVNPRGGFYFIFQGGRPVFQNLDEAGNLTFERHIEGREIDTIVNTLPTVWPRRKMDGDRVLPLVLPVVRTAALDGAGNLWVSFSSVPYTYVFDPSGDKVRVVQFRAAGALSPDGLFFAPDGRLLVAPGCYIYTVR
jgi:hypothetical protein